MIGIICALKIEWDKMQVKMDSRSTEEISGILYTRGFMHGRHVVLALCGVGKVNAAVCAQTMIITYKPRIIINTGVSGSLTSELKTNDVAIGIDVVQHDVDTTAIGDPIGMVSTVNITYFPCDPEISAKLLNAAKRIDGVHAITCRIASGDQFISSGARKAEILSTFNAKTCEMEAGAIAQVCYMNAVRFAAIRSISDSADEASGQDFAQFLESASDTAASVLVNYLSDNY